MGGHGKRAPQKQQEREAKVSRVLAGNELPLVFGFGREEAKKAETSAFLTPLYENNQKMPEL